MTGGWPLTSLRSGQILFLILLYGKKRLNSGFPKTIAVFDVKGDVYCKLNEYMKIHMCLRSRSSLTLVQGVSDFVFVKIFKHLRNHWANQSQISCRSSLRWGNESFFLKMPCPYMVKYLKIFFETNWLMSLKLSIQYQAFQNSQFMSKLFRVKFKTIIVTNKGKVKPEKLNTKN